MEHLDAIGWDRVVSVNADMSVLKLRAWDAQQREHSFDVTIHPGYPKVCPGVQASLPVPVSVLWPARGGLYLIIGMPSTSRLALYRKKQPQPP